MKTIAEQIACAKRELAIRRRVYPQWIARGRMKDRDAQHEIDCMEAIVGSLQTLERLTKAAESL